MVALPADEAFRRLAPERIDDAGEDAAEPKQNLDSGRAILAEAREVHSAAVWTVVQQVEIV